MFPPDALWQTYHIGPAATAKLTLARPTILESKRLVEWDQMLVNNDRQAICNLCLPDPMDVRLHQGASDLLALVFREDGQGVDGNGATVLIMADCLTVLDGDPLGLPVRGEFHGFIRHRSGGGSRGDDMSHQRRARLRLSLLQHREREKTQTEFRTLIKTVDELQAS